MRVKNRSVVRHISFKTLMASKKRNIVAVIAISLTTVLFTALFTICMSFISTYEMNLFKKAGSYAHGTFKCVSEEQMKNIAGHRLVKAYGERIIIGTLTEGKFSNVGAEISYMDDNCSEWCFAKPDRGRNAERSNEIALDTGAIEKLGMEPVLGSRIKLEYELTAMGDGRSVASDEFELVGIWDYDHSMPVHYINVSRDYVSRIMEDYSYLGEFRRDMEVMMRSESKIEDQMVRVDYDLGYNPYSSGDENSVRVGVNWGYMSTQLENNIDAETILAIVAFVLLIAVTGYLIIYNIFRISVAGDIRYYGLLKTIGVTPGQIKSIIRYQALILCVAGIPAGLLAGYLLGSVLTPVILDQTSFSTGSRTISTSFYIWISAAVFSLLTVLVSCSKPGRIAGKVSPVEAVRYTEANVTAKKEQKTRKVNPFTMALANLGRSKGRTALVMVSISLSVVLLNILVSFVSGFDLDCFAERFSSIDFVVADQGFFNNTEKRDDAGSAYEIAKIKQMTEETDYGCGYVSSGVVTEYLSCEQWSNSHRRYYSEADFERMKETDAEEDGTFRQNVILDAYDSYLFSKMTVVKGDIESLFIPNSHNIALVLETDDYGNIYNDDAAPVLGDKIKLSYADSVEYYVQGDDEQSEEGTTDTRVGFKYANSRDVFYDITALVCVPLSISERHSYLGNRYILAKDVLEADSGYAAKELFYAFDVKDEQLKAEVEDYLKNLVAAGNTSVKYESRESVKKDFEDMRNMFLIIGGVLCTIIALIGILNYINTIMTGVFARQKELAILQAVGMTGKQLKHMLMNEGLLYTVGSGVISFIISAAMNPIMGNMLESVFWFYRKNTVLWPVGTMIPLFALLGAIVPILLYRRIKQKSIVENISAF